MTPPTPIALLVDDPTPFVHLYRHHITDISGKHSAGRKLKEEIPDAFLDRFIAVTRERRMAGKFSIVPAPMFAGDVVHGIAGRSAAETQAWVRTAQAGLGERFDFSPEMITHSWTMDLETGAPLTENEHDWSQHQSRAGLTPYLTRALELLRDAGVDATGFTSPWFFGQRVEAEYVAAMAAAQRTVHGRDFSWYFLHVKTDPMTKPWVASREGGATVVSIPASMDDALWDTIWKHGRPDPALVSRIADAYLSADGRSGRVREVLDAGGWPVLVTHWQSLWSNGHETGLRVLDEVGRRIAERLGGGVRWSSCLEMSRLTAGVSPPAS